MRKFSQHLYHALPNDESHGELASSNFYFSEQESGSVSSRNQRGEKWDSLLRLLVKPLLRLGLLLQLSAIIIGFMAHQTFKGQGLFSFDFLIVSDVSNQDPLHSKCLIILQILYWCGSFCLAFFQIFIADSAETSRGFRCGSRMLSTAVTLDCFSTALGLTGFFYSYLFRGERWWLKYIVTNTDRCLFQTSSFLHSIALSLYGFAFCYLEFYHEKSNSELAGWTCFWLYNLSAATEIILAFFKFGSFATIIQLLALSSASAWSHVFERTLSSSSAKLHDSNANKNLRLNS